MEELGEVFILLRDTDGEKPGLVFGTSSCNVLRGELAVSIEKPRKDGQPQKYQTVYTDQQATFYDDDENSPVAPLLDNQHLLLAGVKSNDARYQIFITGKLEWGSNLKLNNPVLVSLKHPQATDTKATIKSPAVIQYVGPVKGLLGIIFGVEIVDPHYYGQGTTDGTFQGERYFTCNDGNGLFVTLDKLSQLPQRGYVPEVPPRPDDQQPATQTAGKQEEKKKRRNKAFRFQLQDRVVAFKNDGMPIHGTVMWVGMYEVLTKKNQPFSVAAVGIETDEKVVGSEMESCLPPKHYLFSVGKKKGSLFIREEEVILESDFNSQHPPATSSQLPHQPSHKPRQDGYPPPSYPKKQPAAQPQQRHHYREEKPPDTQRGPAHPGRGPKEPLAVDDPRKLAQQMGVGSPTRLMQEQTEALQKAAEEKKGRELEGIRQALDPGESLHVEEQARLMRQFSEGKRQNEMHRNNVGHRDVDHTYDVIPNTPPSHRADGQSGQSQGPNLAHPLAQPNTGHPPWQQQQQGYPQQQQYQQQSNSQQPQGYPPYNSPAQQATHQPNIQQPPSSGQHVAYAGPPGISHSTGPPDPSHSAGLGVGSPVQLLGDYNHTGVIRWMGTLPEVKGPIAGVELDGPMEGCEDGVWRGRRYFTCLPGRGFFCPVTSLLPDTRLPQSSQVGGATAGNPLKASGWEEQDQLINAGQIQKYIGEGKGIQGHQNSCYLDATIFGLFALSDVFDSLFLESSTMSMKGSELSSTVTRVKNEISQMLWRGIVNPLRKNGAVPYESVMMLRNRLDDLGKMEGVNTAEKDPEEFLNMLFKHTLCVEPFIKIKRPFGTEPEFFVQLFVEFDESLKVPTVQALLEKMFREQQISFDGVPSKLLVQVPRYGKQFQTYKRIIPGVKLDPTPLIDCPYTCYICQDKAWNTCDDCKSEFSTHLSSDGAVYLCNDCNDKVHKHEARKSHKHEKCSKLDEGGDLELLSVLCIETSHYVCFTRDSEGRWLFFDSMANRVYDQYNIPRGVDCTDWLNDWVYLGSSERLMAAGSRELPELVRRFTQDVYMCVYIQPDYGMYG